MSEGLKLRAEDAADLAVIAAALESAVVRAADMAYTPREHRFAIMFNRFCGERAPKRGPKGDLWWRARSGLHFNGVLAVKSTGFDPGDADRVLELLDISVEMKDAPAAEVTLLFAADTAVRLDVECVDAVLADIGQPWTTPNRPDHGNRGAGQ